MPPDVNYACVCTHLCPESVITDFYRVPYAIVSMEMHLLCVASKPSLEITAVLRIMEGVAEGYS